MYNANHQKGKVFTIDLNGDVQTQLQNVFNEIAAILKLRLIRNSNHLAMKCKLSHSRISIRHRYGYERPLRGCV